MSDDPHIGVIIDSETRQRLSITSDAEKYQEEMKGEYEYASTDKPFGSINALSELHCNCNMFGQSTNVFVVWEAKLPLFAFTGVIDREDREAVIQDIVLFGPLVSLSQVMQIFEKDDTWDRVRVNGSTRSIRRCLDKRAGWNLDDDDGPEYTYEYPKDKEQPAPKRRKNE